MRSVLWALLPVLACASRSAPGTTRIDLHLDGIDGLSDLTTDGGGVHWAVPERDRFLVAIEGHRLTRRLPLRGIPAGVDTESLAWVSDRTFAIGTESMDAHRMEDPVFLVRVDGSGAEVVGTLGLPYAHLGVAPEENRGIEGLCSVDQILLAAVEETGVVGGRRFAPVARHALTPSGDWETFRVALTSSAGKLAALACRRAGGDLEVLAIERHYEVMRIVGFRIPALGPGRTVTAHVVRDLAGALSGDPNIEGLTPEGTDLLLVIDNHHGTRTGPNEIIRVRPRAGHPFWGP